MASDDNDEDVCDSWEDMAESGELERRMEEREKERMQISNEIDKKLFDPGVKVLVESESTRTHYIPQVRILRRDPNDALPDSSKSEENKNKKIHKTLAQREAEYASARARILGKKENSLEDTSDQLPKMTLDEKLPDNLIRQPRQRPTTYCTFERRNLPTLHHPFEDSILAFSPGVTADQRERNC